MGRRYWVQALTDGGGLLVNGPFRLVGATIAGCTAGMYGGGLEQAVVAVGDRGRLVLQVHGGDWRRRLPPAGGNVGISGGATWEGCTTTNMESTFSYFNTEVMGGGLLATDRANLDLADVTIRGSRGGNLNLRGDSQLVMVRTLIEGGVGKWGAGLGMVGGEARISDSTFRGLSTGPMDGGAGAYIISGATLTCDRCHFHNNLAAWGAAMVVEGGSTATVRDSIIARNGGSPAGKEPRPVVECLFGGGFVVWQGATLTILNSEIEENVARYGGS